MKKNNLSFSRVPNFKQKYSEEVIPKVREELKLSNNLAVPRITRIVVNTGIGKIREQENLMKSALHDLRQMTGQQPVFVIAKQAIAGFKIKQGDKVGLKVTLRGNKMWEFLEKLIVAALPNVRDFQGISLSSFGGTGDCSIGIKEHIVFPEINPDEANYIFGLQVNIVTTAKTQAEGISLMKALGLPLQK